MSMYSVQDQTGNFVSLSSHPQRIVSLVPSQTELLYTLGLDRKVVGITRFCVHPHSWFTTRQRIGGTKQVNLVQLRALKPDLVLANKEENVKEQVEEIRTFCPVYTSNVRSLDDAMEMIQQIGYLTGADKPALQLIQAISNRFDQLPAGILGNALYLIWKNPYMAAGNDTFINHMMQRAGFRNALQEARYPQLNVERIRELNPGYILLSSEPYPFTTRHLDELGKLCPQSRLLLVNGEFFSWYGSRLLLAADYFAELRESLFLKNNEIN